MAHITGDITVVHVEHASNRLFLAVGIRSMTNDTNRLILSLRFNILVDHVEMFPGHHFLFVHEGLEHVHISFFAFAGKGLNKIESFKIDDTDQPDPKHKNGREIDYF